MSLSRVAARLTFLFTLAIIISAVMTVGARAADTYYTESHAPTGVYAGKAPRGIMLAVHGGAWLLTGPKLVEMARDDSQMYRAQGWRTVVMDYRPGGVPSFQDVRTEYNRLAHRYHKRFPICLYGESAGGHMVLQLAATARPDCVITVGAPTDLPRLYPDNVVIKDANIAFGNSPGGLWGWSPANPAVGNRIRARVLLAQSADDMIVPAAQMTAAKQVIYKAQSVLMHNGPGATFFVHANVSSASRHRFTHKAFTLLRQTVKAFRAAHPTKHHHH